MMFQNQNTCSYTSIHLPEKIGGTGPESSSRAENKSQDFFRMPDSCGSWEPPNHKMSSKPDFLNLRINPENYDIGHFLRGTQRRPGAPGDIVGVPGEPKGGPGPQKNRISRFINVYV